MADKKKQRGLGRGLSALMADVTEEAVQRETGRPQRADLTVAIEKIRPNPDQPRRDFTQDQLDELAASIREKGVIQPLIVRETANGYEIVAGERRWRAAQMAQLHELPVIVRDYLELSHRFCGPMTQCHRVICEINAGRKPEPVTLREQDYWQEVATDLNEMISRLDLSEASATSKNTTQIAADEIAKPTACTTC